MWGRRGRGPVPYWSEYYGWEKKKKKDLSRNPADESKFEQVFTLHVSTEKLEHRDDETLASKAERGSVLGRNQTKSSSQ